MVAGAYLSDTAVVKMIIEGGPDAIRDLINWGSTLPVTKKIAMI